MKKGLGEEKNDLINTEKKYYDLEKETEIDFRIATDELNQEQGKLEKISKNLSLNAQGKDFKEYLNNITKDLEEIKIQLENNDKETALNSIKKIIFTDK